MKLLLLASILVSANAISNEVPKDQSNFVKIRDATYSTPPVIYLGTRDGHVTRCLQEDPHKCEFVYKHPNPWFLNGVNSLIIRGECIYAGLNSGQLLRCDLNIEPSCKIFEFHTPVDALTVGEGYLFIGLRNYTVMRCEDDSCRPLHEVTNMIDSLAFDKEDKHIYIGQYSGQISRCSTTENSCTSLMYLPEDSPVTSFARIGDRMYVATWIGRIYNCPQFHKHSSSKDCAPIDVQYANLTDIAAYNNSIYVFSHNGIYKLNDSRYVSADNTSHMAFAYGTYHMQSKYKNEHKICTRQRNSQCLPVIYYNERQRSTLEVHVKDGKLYDAQDSLVDTSDADIGQTGAAAIFAMGPDGRILLSNWHKPGLIHTSSLFAGGPVSGAGEMVVKKGVIQTIRAFSEHYRPDQDLNKQVIQSLRTQGYTEPIDLKMCCRDDDCLTTVTDNI